MKSLIKKISPIKKFQTEIQEPNFEYQNINEIDKKFDEIYNQYESYLKIKEENDKKRNLKIIFNNKKRRNKKRKNFSEDFYKQLQDVYKNIINEKSNNLVYKFQSPFIAAFMKTLILKTINESFQNEEKDQNFFQNGLVIFLTFKFSIILHYFLEIL